MEAYLGGRSSWLPCVIGLVLVLVLGSGSGRAADRTIWAKHWHGPDENPVAGIATDAAGNIYVAGISEHDRISVAKFDPSGHELWRSKYDESAGGGAGYATGIALDKSGGVYVTGACEDPVHGQEIATLKYSAATGSLLWSDKYHAADGPYDDEPGGLAYDSFNNWLFVCGSACAWHANGNVNYDYAVIRYNPADGSRVWVRLCDFGPDVDYGDEGDFAVGICLGLDRYPVVTGYYLNDDDDAWVYDWATVCLYSNRGVVAWTRFDNWSDEDDEKPLGICSDPNGNIYLAGYRYHETAEDENYEAVFMRITGNNRDCDKRYRGVTECDCWGLGCEYNHGRVYCPVSYTHLRAHET